MANGDFDLNYYNNYMIIHTTTRYELNSIGATGCSDHLILKWEPEVGSLFVIRHSNDE